MKLLPLSKQREKRQLDPKSNCTVTTAGAPLVRQKGKADAQETAEHGFPREHHTRSALVCSHGRFHGVFLMLHGASLDASTLVPCITLKAMSFAQSVHDL